MAETVETPSLPDLPDDALSGEEMTRRQFLTKATIGVGAIMGAMIAAPIAGMAIAPAVKGRHKIRIVALDDHDKPIVTKDLPEGTYTKMVLKFPDEVGGDGYVRERVGFVRRNAEGYVDPLTGDKGGLTVISNRCVHLGCPVQETGGTFVCPCHGGAYDEAGQRTAGPPVRPLDRFTYETEKGTGHLYITGEYSLTKNGKKKDAVYGPGQHTSGPQQFHYILQP